MEYTMQYKLENGVSHHWYGIDSNNEKNMNTIFSPCSINCIPFWKFPRLPPMHVQTHLPALFWAAALHGLQDMVDLLRQTLSVVHLFAKLAAR